MKLATLGDVVAIEKKLKKNSRKKLSRAIYAAALQRALGFGHRALAEKLGAQGLLPNLFFPDSVCPNTLRGTRQWLSCYKPIASGWLSFPQIFAALQQDTIEKCFGNSWTACFVNVGNITLTFYHFLTHPEARHGSFLGRRTSGLLHLSSDPCSGRKR